MLKGSTESQVGSWEEEMMKSLKAALLASAAVMAASHGAKAQGQVNLLCSVQVEWCQAIATNFQKDTGITVNMTQKGSGEAFAQIRAEKDNPKVDVWFGGTGDPHLAAAEEGLSEVYKSALNEQLQPWALRQYEASKGRSVGVYSGAVGFGFNTELLKKKNIEPPKCWADIIKPPTRAKSRSRTRTLRARPMSSSPRWSSSWASSRPSTT